MQCEWRSEPFHVFHAVIETWLLANTAPVFKMPVSYAYASRAQLREGSGGGVATPALFLKTISALFPHQYKN